MNPGYQLGGLVGSPKPLIAPLPYAAHRDSFHRWMLNKHCEHHAKNLISYSDRYLPPHIENQFRLKEVFDSVAVGKRSLCLAIRNFLNYLEEFSLLSDDDLRRYRKVVKIPKTGTDDYYPDTTRIMQAYRQFDSPDHSLCFEVMLYSGIRPIEAVELLRTYDPSRVMNDGTIAKYPLSMDRVTKRVLYVYVPAWFVPRLRVASLNVNALKVYFSRRGLGSKYLRKWHYNFLIENGVPESVCDFIQGRSLGKSVGGLHYLAKTRQADRFYSGVVTKFPLKEFVPLKERLLADGTRGASPTQRSSSL